MKKKQEENYLENISVINGDVSWEEKNGLVTVHQPNKGLYNKVTQTIFKAPKISHIDLDEFGSFVWLQIDGEKDIAEIGKAVKIEFGEKVEPLYERLAHYFATLNDVKYITLRRERN